MSLLKSLLRGSLSTIFKLSLLLLIVVGPFVMVFGTSNQLKQSLKHSDIYASASSSIVDTIAKDNSSDNSSAYTQAAVQQAAETALSPSFLETSSNQIIDGIYGWLQGKTAQPQFNIDISGVKQQFTAAVEDYAVNRAQQLPACTLQQARELGGGDIDPITVPCIPAGFDINSLRSQVNDSLNKQDDGQDNILQQSSLTPDTLPKNDQGQTPVQALTNKAGKAPEVFAWLKRAPLILGAVAVLSGGLIVVLYDDKRRGLRHIAIVLAVLGVITLIGVLLTKTGFDRLTAADGPLGTIDANLKEPVLVLVRSLNSAFNRGLLIYGGTYAVLGVGTLLALHFTKPKAPVNDTVATDAPDAPMASDEPETPPVEEPKPNRPPRLIQ